MAGEQQRVFMRDLRDLFAGKSAEHLLPVWLQEFVDAQACTPLGCRHDQIRPAGEQPCYAQGGTDQGKGMAIRKSTVLASARRYLGIRDGGGGASPSTKVRVHVLCYLRRFTGDSEQFRGELQRLLSTDLVVGHRCGCGNCDSSVRAGKACTRPEHLDLVPQGHNRHQVPLHHLLAACDASEYATVVAVVNRLPYARNIF